jgi:citrate synthase
MEGKQMDNEHVRFEEDINVLAKKCEKCSQINPEWYGLYDVKRGLREISGKGVLAGLTEIGEVSAYDIVEGEYVPKQGQLFYRGINIESIVNGFIKDCRFGFEEICYQHLLC